ncbi:MAG: isocitrate/isopropylmalate dehydrogenase family protein [Dethiobacteria bacterium]
MHRVTLLRGDGSGPDISAAVLKVIDGAGVKIEWEEVIAGEEALKRYGTPLPDEAVESIRRNKVALKGPLTTPVGTGFRSVNVALRQKLNLYANLRPAKSYPGVRSHYKDIDLVVVRENTEGLYSGVEHKVGEDAAESIKIITRKASENIVRFAFDYAVRNGRKKVTAVHKANILKLSDGLFLEVAHYVAKEYPAIEFEDRIVDNMCMQLVQKPHLYDVMVMPNFYGDFISDLCAGLVGGVGLAPGANIGKEIAVFEPVHGSAPKYAGMNKVNPSAMLLSAVLMLEYLGEDRAAKLIESSLAAIIAGGKEVTYDLGGTASTSEMANAIIRKMKDRE